MFMENLAANLGTNNLHYGQIDAIRSYKLSQELNLDYPLVTETVSDRINIMLSIFKDAHIGKFYYACPSTAANDEIATCFMVGWRICDVIPKEHLLGEKSYKTCSNYVLLLKRV